MQNYDIFSDIAERTGGDIYFGVVGPVRTGKSTFIKRFMELLVLPNIVNVFERERARDELPQSGAGRRITTTEPKFIPSEAVEVVLKDTIHMNVRMVDCVGYAVSGALGYEGEEDEPRMVHTPWNDEPIPFEEAAEIGTRKVITDHSTLGIAITTDGSISEIPRENYLEAEQRVVSELKEIGKPFILLLNTTKPYAESTMELCRGLEQEYQVPVIPVDCMEMNLNDISQILEEILYEFPVAEVNIELPKWVEELDLSHPIRAEFENVIQKSVGDIKRIRDIDHALEILSECPHSKDIILKETDLGTGHAEIEITTEKDLFKQVLEQLTGINIEGDHTLLRMILDYSKAKKEWDKLSKAFEEVKTNGYGVVTPQLDEMFLEEPELVKSGGHFGIKLKASAPSLHILRADVTTEITPLIGTEKQAEELVKYLLEEFESDPKKLWGSNIFGKSLHDLVREGIQNKLYKMPDNVQIKLQDTLQRIVNEGHGGLICIII
ncbi:MULTISPECIES: stage IV sporulation protein A [Dehalobacter]|uniref:Stage IV sporulation protein A n=2 Tax=Dehalobacter restrictus TaxID=55583 RepID=A0A857DKD9_9FIRM|nr:MULTISPECIES: stage IV sporulation protein A [Dehalobacter]AHF10269.1 stage IV sporulation protein A [Dehalobacter restrictus DSM 9455]MCG1024277.1 stage IV sporulation protein A [Dehalobacter sp.]MDJ0306082.1 stage IV sporulation protein A [Dehalobacter sp.]QHA00855.1 stage IV sporulation protein A [Dehalobacter restrictus]